MREKIFVEQNKEKWGQFEGYVAGKSNPGPGELRELYTHITDDLSYARTYYGKRSIRVYLNSLAQKAYLALYKNQIGLAKGFGSFWTDTLPLALYRSRKELNISLVVFVLFMAIGVFSSVHDPDFAKVILGDEYIAMTEDNIRRGDPMGVYKTAHEMDMFLAITLNNLLVAFRTWVLGAFFGIGSLAIMLYNGIMVGTFQYFFVERGLFAESFLTIWMHGALEISSIVIAGAAGLTLGRGLLYPGNLPRLQSFQLGARRSITIMLGLVPFFVTAAFIEGFFTRITEMPDLLKASFIALCFLFVGVFFWWYPNYRYRHQDPDLYIQEDLLPDQKLEIKLPELRKTKEIFTGAFGIMRSLEMRSIGAGSLFALVYCLFFFFVYGKEGIERIDFVKFSPNNFYQFHNYSTFRWNIAINILFITALLAFSLRLFAVKFRDQLSNHANFGWRLLLKCLILVSSFELMLLSGNGIVATLAIISIPYLLFLLVVSALEGLSLPDAFSRMLYILNGTRRHIFITFLLTAALAFVLMLLLDSPFTWFYIDVVQWNLDAEEDTKLRLSLLTILFVNMFGLGMVLPLFLFSQLLEYFAAVEAKGANMLASRVLEIGTKRKAYGMERE